VKELLVESKLKDKKNLTVRKRRKRKKNTKLESTYLFCSEKMILRFILLPGELALEIKCGKKWVE